MYLGVPDEGYLVVRIVMLSFILMGTEGAVAGATAGVVVETALYPIDTIKTRLQVSAFEL